jgi:hypothetical protein
LFEPQDRLVGHTAPLDALSSSLSTELDAARARARDTAMPHESLKRSWPDVWMFAELIAACTQLWIALVTSAVSSAWTRWPRSSV